MNKLLILGYPSSGSRTVEDILLSSGMRPALPSQKEQLSPQEIVEILAKAQGITLDSFAWNTQTPPSSNTDALPHSSSALQEATALAPLLTDDLSELEPQIPSPVWSGLTLDLMLANIDQPLWGWQDPNLIHFLDYFQSLDDKLGFILVYTHPKDLFPLDQPLAQPQALLLQHWKRYQQALLRFFWAHPERCLLVHATQVQRQADRYIAAIQERLIGKSGQSGQGILDLKTATENESANHDQSNTALDTLDVSNANRTNRATDGGTPSSSSALLALLEQAHQEQIEALIQTDASAIELYETMQAIAHLPLEQSAPNADNTKTLNKPLSAQVAYQEWLSRQELLHTTEQNLQSLRTESEATKTNLHQQLTQLHADANAKMAELSKLHTESEANKAALNEKLTQSTEESELLLTQLHTVQEKLERYYLEKQALQSQTTKTESELQAKQQLLRALEQKLAEAQKQSQNEVKALNEALAKNKLEYQQALAATQAKTVQLTPARTEPKLSELEEENELLLTQLHTVQEELERYYLENQKLKQAKAAPAKPPKSVYYGAADRVKNQLGYRLGAEMLSRSRSFSGYLGMPFALLAVQRRYRQELKEKKHNPNEQTKLPPIENYQDAHEAERVKQHLSYRLGQTLLRYSKGWRKLALPLTAPTVLPFALWRQVKAFRREKGAKYA